MNLSHAFPLPLYTEEALGYKVRSPSQWMGVYRNVSGQVIWDDGFEEGAVEVGLLTIFAKLWGPLPAEYGYLFDRTKRIVHVLGISGLQLFLANLEDQEAAAGWLTDGEATAALIATLISYAQEPVDAAECLECYHGYTWIEGLQAFLPCACCTVLSE